MVVTSSTSPSSFTKDGISGASTILFNPETSKYTITIKSWRKIETKYTIVTRTIETTVTDKAAIVDQWIQDINVEYPPNSSVIVGLDVERNSSAGIGIKSATLHLCIENKCLILQLKYIDNLPLSLKNFLMNPNFFFVGFEVDSDIDLIKKDHDLNCGGRADIKGLAIAKWPNRFSKPGLKDLAKELIDLSMKKPKLLSLSNWENRVLTIEQVEYGSIHAYACYHIGSLLLKDD